MEDGSHTLYRIQHQNLDDGNMIIKGEWDYSNFDYFGVPPNTYWSSIIGNETGFDTLKDAEVAFDWLRKKWPKYQFRIIKQIITLKTIV